eukprot:Pgem_evm1s1279
MYERQKKAVPLINNDEDDGEMEEEQMTEVKIMEMCKLQKNGVSNKGFICYGAPKGAIIRIIQIKATHEFLESFLKVAQEEVTTSIPWLLKEDIPMETKQLCQQLITNNHRRMKNFPDMNSLLSCYSLATECNKHPVHVLISNIFKLKPAPVVAYTKTMGGEDILSRLIRDYTPIADSTLNDNFLNIKKVDDLQSIAQLRKRRENTTGKGGYQRFVLDLPIPELLFEKDDADKDTPERGKSKAKKNSTGTIYNSKTVTPHKNTTPSTIIFCLLCHQRFHIQDIHVTSDAVKE